MYFELHHGGVTIAQFRSRQELDGARQSGLIPDDGVVVSVATADDVRAEAARRMRDLVGARDDAHLTIVLSNGSREAIRLLRIKAARPWLPEEAARAAQLEAVDQAIEVIRAMSNTMEANPPADFANDARWQ